MIYTIAILEEVHGNLTLNFDKVGNQYLVGIYNKETKEYTHKKFDDINAATQVFNELSKMIIKGLYSEEQKRQYLLKS